MVLHKETSFVRETILPFIPNNIDGIDIGFGGDKIRDDFKGCDLSRPYGAFGTKEFYDIDIPCDVKNGIPVNDNSFDVVYSSHLIEDFVDTGSILKEFIRICKPKGKIVLVFPNQRKYEEFCRKNNSIPNGSHKIPEMGITYMVQQINKFSEIDVDSMQSFELGSYNCVVIFNLKKGI